MNQNYKKEFGILSALLASQSIIHVFPSIKQIAEFSTGALKSLGCFENSGFSLQNFKETLGDKFPESEELTELVNLQKGKLKEHLINFNFQENIATFSLKTYSNFFGFAILKISDPNCFELFKPAINNFINTLAVHIENIIQNQEITQHHLHLKDLVEKRTSELKLEISQRKEIQELLEKSEKKFKTIYEVSPVGIELFDADGKMLGLNDACLKIFGLENASYVDTFNLFEDPNLDSSLFDKLKNGELIRKEIEFDFGKVHALNLYKTDKNGIIFLDLIITPIKGIFAKSDINYIVYIRDITESKKYADEIKRRNDELNKINAEKDKFFSIVAHDLRSPFQGFLGLTGLLADNISDFTNEEIADINKRINNNARNLFKLLNDLLEWASIKKGTFDFEPIEKSLFEISNDSFDAIKQSALQKNITLQNDISKNINVYADEKMIRSVILNLITNAVKFTNHGGKVILNANQNEPDLIQISVSDNGIGMKPDLVKMLFRIDEKVGLDGTDGEKSTGLGLLLCKEFIDIHKGEIWCESQENVGTTFYFTLPKSKTKL